MSISYLIFSRYVLRAIHAIVFFHMQPKNYKIRIISLQKQLDEFKSSDGKKESEFFFMIVAYARLPFVPAVAAIAF